MTYDVIYTKEIFAGSQTGMSCFQQTHVSEVDGFYNRLWDDDDDDDVDARIR